MLASRRACGLLRMPVPDVRVGCSRTRPAGLQPRSRRPYGDDLTNVGFPTPGVAYDGYNQVRRTESIRQQFVNHGASTKPLWLTEIGWPTCASGSTRCTTQSGQASDLTSLFNNARGSWSSYVAAVFVYCYQDNGSNSADPENDYGLVDYNGNAKAALSVYKTQNAMR